MCQPDTHLQELVSNDRYLPPMDMQSQQAPAPAMTQVPAQPVHHQLQDHTISQLIQHVGAVLQPRPEPEPQPLASALTPCQGIKQADNERPSPECHVRGDVGESLGGCSEPDESLGRWLDSPHASQDSGPVAAGLATTPSVFTPHDGEQSMEGLIRSFCDPENQRLMKPRFSVQDLSADEAMLAHQSTLTQTRRFPALFATAATASAALGSFQSLFQKPEGDATTPLDDDTFPATDEAMAAAVERVFDAICDWTHVLEWKSTLSRDAKSRVTEALMARSHGRGDPESLRPTDEELRGILPAIEVQQQRILGQTPSDQTMEWISWGIVEAAIISQQGNTQLPCWCEADGG
ncbi:hypothetical protein G6O67_004244 [Ophiocordyceps sinensis]|uniref:Uncharacterized protein n=2 Tax=Ophiocordyceps sinensis TaxID=72228 RepID=A0A8H4LZ21_9HYPO|nr:hypothetical protein G6O67_004244 [Ophiocordyceps sinensis]